MTKQKVLFLCTGNSARSQMAEAILKKYACDRFEAHSAGLDPKGIHPLTRIVLEEAGISLEDHRSKSVSEYLAQVNISHFITVCSHAEQNCPRAFLMSANKHLFWDFEDPAAGEGSDEERLAKFREVRDRIDEKIREWLKKQGCPVH
ncbi:arsenate reductase ArsC [Desulfonatronovibrio hydrogenovorans]|uniref:arsenate reductase ArsC n=1 Tax=Desulfonatronovibrio hydrogenovorans TaxID=53245 RepID=UPI00048C7841|nr:arsenate reductase ArsC [Desulfonatronovibrio hydrogenovorans]